jgi:hypothetical protein
MLFTLDLTSLEILAHPPILPANYHNVLFPLFFHAFKKTIGSGKYCQIQYFLLVYIRT